VLAAAANGKATAHGSPANVAEKGTSVLSAAGGGRVGDSAGPRLIPGDTIPARPDFSPPLTTGHRHADYTCADVAKMLDHSLLQPVLTDADLEKGCRLAREYQVASVCIKPYAVKMAPKSRRLRGRVGTVIGFPQAATSRPLNATRPRPRWPTGVRAGHGRHIGKVLSATGVT